MTAIPNSQKFPTVVMLPWEIFEILFFHVGTSCSFPFTPPLHYHYALLLFGKYYLGKLVANKYYETSAFDEGMGPHDSMKLVVEEDGKYKLSSLDKCLEEGIVKLPFAGS